MPSKNRLYHSILQPPHWPLPRGYSNGVCARGERLIYTGGIIGWDAEGNFQSHDFVDQVKTTLENIIILLQEADAAPEHLVRLTWYITDRDLYKNNQKRLGEVYREVMGSCYPPMALVQVLALMEEEALVEIEATAVV